MTELLYGPGLENLFVVAVLVALAVPAGFGAYWMQRRHMQREMSAIAMQERHLYRMLQDQMHDIEKLRIVQHDAKNELFVLQGFLERGEEAAARDYVAQLLLREEAL